MKDRYPKPWIYYLISFLRFATISSIAFLLLSPIINYLKTKEEKPTIAFVQDNSASQKFAFKKIDSVAYRKNVVRLLDELRKDYNVKEYSLGETLHDSINFKYNEPKTEITSSLETIMTSLESQNLGAIVLASDGIFNEGASPLSTNYPFKGAIYTIGIGDTTMQRDALVARVFANRIVNLGDQFSIRSDMAAFSCQGKSITVNVYSHNAKRIIASQQIAVNSNRFSKGIETILDAKSIGLQHYTISVSQVEGDQNMINNSQDIYVNVVDNKEKVLIVANAPHPDIFALRDALSKNKNFKVDVQTASKMNANVNDYNLIILHNLPSPNFNASNLIENAKRNGTSIWYIVGQQTALGLLNTSQNAIQFSPRGIGMSDVQGSLNKDFSFFTINTNNQVNALPPLNIPFGEAKIGPNSQVLMYQKIGSLTTNYPLWTLQPNTNGRVGVLFGEGIWRWRLYDFNQHKNHNLVDEYLTKTAQYLSMKNDKQQFNVQISKNVFSESEAITFDAELYNENYELINSPEVNLSIDKNQSEATKYIMNKVGDSYNLSIGNKAAGNYTFHANTAFNGKSYTANGSFVVLSQNIEQMNTTADFGMLNQLAKNYGGEFLYQQQMNGLVGKIKANQNIKPILKSNTQTDPLIDWKWIFGLLLALLTIEWFVRKRTGNY